MEGGASFAYRKYHGFVSRPVVDHTSVRIGTTGCPIERSITPAGNVCHETLVEKFALYLWTDLAESLGRIHIPPLDGIRLLLLVGWFFLTATCPWRPFVRRAPGWRRRLSGSPPFGKPGPSTAEAEDASVPAPLKEFVGVLVLSTQDTNCIQQRLVLAGRVGRQQSEQALQAQKVFLWECKMFRRAKGQ